MRLEELINTKMKVIEGEKNITHYGQVFKNNCFDKLFSKLTLIVITIKEEKKLKSLIKQMINIFEACPLRQ